MLNIFICEDDPAYLSTITKMVENYTTMHEVAMKLMFTCTTPAQLLGYLESNPGNAGLYFLDLHLNSDINGIQLAAHIRKHDPRGFVVFITSDADAYKLTFKHKVEALDYIEKGEPNLEQRVLECLTNAADKYTATATEMQKTFTAKLSDDTEEFDKNSTMVTNYSNILCFVTHPQAKRTIILHKTDGRVQFGGSLKDVEATLNDPRFYRCQNDLIINLDKVRGVNTTTFKLVFEGGLVVDVAARRVKELADCVREYSRR